MDGGVARLLDCGDRGSACDPPCLACALRRGSGVTEAAERAVAAVPVIRELERWWGAASDVGSRSSPRSIYSAVDEGDGADGRRCAAANRDGRRCRHPGLRRVPEAGWVCASHLAHGWTPHAPAHGVDEKIAAAQRRVLGEEG